MIEEGTPPSPWWYRRRPYLIAAIYGVGFLLSNVSFDGRRALPAAVQWGSRWGDSGVSILFWAGVALAVAGWLVRVSGTAYLRGDVVFAGDVQRDRLIIAGPFRYVRNPLYLGDDLLALGIGLYAAPLGFAIVVIANVLFGVVLANEEERQLGRRHGIAYDAYRAAVPAFLPRLRPATLAVSTPVKPSLRGGLLAESFSLALALALVPIALFGPRGLPAAGVIYVAAMLLLAGASRMSAQRTRSGTSREIERAPQTE